MKPNFKEYDRKFEAWLEELRDLLPADYQKLTLYELSETLKKWDLDTAWCEYSPNEFAEMISVEL